MLNSNSDDGETLYSDSVFSTYLYTGSASTPQTINNGIDLAGKGGLVWVKSRNNASATAGHALFDTVRGRSYGLATQTTAAQIGPSAGGSDLVSFNSNGFTVGSNNSWAINVGIDYASWTFRKAAKFFDIVTWTGDGNVYPANRTINHSLGSTPGMIIIKVTSATDDWVVYHNNWSYATSKWFRLNTTEAPLSGTTVSAVNSTSFTVTDQVAYTGDSLNQLNQTYVAYVFGHDTTSTGMIQTGNYTGNGSATGPIVSLGWEPQWLIIKNATGTGSWQIIDNMRGMSVGGADATLQSNASTAETSVDYVSPTATGFQITSTSAEVNTNAATYIYMAIRRPNKPPTSGTQVFQTITAQGDLVQTSTATFPLDMQFNTFYDQSNSTYNNQINDRLRGIGFSPTFNATPHLTTALTAAETTSSSYLAFNGNGMDVTKSDGWGTWKAIFYNFKRAPGFFDMVCYTGTNSNQAVAHNLGVIPELIFAKSRSIVADWCGVRRNGGNIAFGMSISSGDALQYGASFPFVPSDISLTATSMNPQFFESSAGTTRANALGGTYVAYLFATLAGISKVGSYTGNGSSQTIACGFAAGARFILIKRTDAAGDWYVWDSARGIVAANDPHLSLNTIAAHVTTDDSIDPDNSGFIVNQVAATNINVTSATYIFLAIA
jgi:hypothetical protein